MIFMEKEGEFINPNGARGTMCPHFFQKAISSWKEGSGGPKFFDFSKFIMNFENLGFHSFLRWSSRCIILGLNNTKIYMYRNTLK